MKSMGFVVKDDRPVRGYKQVIMQKKNVTDQPTESRRAKKEEVVTVNRNQPYSTDPQKKAEVEKAAIEETTKYFKSKDYEVDDVAQYNYGWDLQATKEGKELQKGEEPLLLEVKGLSGNGNPLSVELTPNEYDKALEKDNYRLCVVSAALDEPHLVICKYNKNTEEWAVEGKPTASVDVTEKTGASIKITI